MLPECKNLCPETPKSSPFFSSYKILLFQENNKIFSKEEAFSKLQLPLLAQYLTEMFQCFILHRKKLEQHTMCV